MVFMRLLPRKSSRTSTHAVIVPSTALTAETISAAPSVSFNAATASGADTTAQNSCQPCFPDAQTSAAIGSTHDQREEGRDEAERRAVAALSLGERALRRADERIAALASSRASDRLLDLRPSGPCSGRTTPCPRRASRRCTCRRSGRSRAATGYFVGVLGADLLFTGRQPYCANRCCASSPFMKRMNVFATSLFAAVLDHRDRQLDQHRLARDHVLDVLCRPGAR